VPRTAQVNKEIREETTEKILSAAKKVFARKGISAKMSEVATEAGVSPGLAYHYFPSKEAIFVALVRQITVPTEEVHKRAEKILGSPLDQLSQMVTNMVERRWRDPGFYQLLRQALSNDALPRDLRRAVLSQGLAIHDIMRRLIVKGQARGEIANDNPDKLVRAILACLDGLSGMAPPSPELIEKQMPDARIILRMLRPDQHQE
jgi:AcrR family transcriptional regulator